MESNLVLKHISYMKPESLIANLSPSFWILNYGICVFDIH